MTTAEIREALRTRFSPPAWALFEELRDATGYGASRTADAVALNLWPSQGLELWGFEIKTGRGDWLREIKRPEKADGVLSYCDRVYVVAGGKGIVQPEELPPGWGLMEPHGQSVRRTREADKNPNALPLDRAFVASMMRQAERYIAVTIRDSDYARQEYDRGVRAGQQGMAYDLDQMKQQLDTYRAMIAKFERASGVTLNQYDGPEIGRAMKMLLQAGVVSMEERLTALHQRVGDALRQWRGDDGRQEQGALREVQSRED